MFIIVDTQVKSYLLILLIDNFVVVVNFVWIMARKNILHVVSWEDAIESEESEALSTPGF